VWFLGSSPLVKGDLVYHSRRERRHGRDDRGFFQLTDCGRTVYSMNYSSQPVLIEHAGKIGRPCSQCFDLEGSQS
jgi:hypothetical protein